MKQVVQNYKTGAVTLEEVPSPQCSSKTILVRNAASLVSIGTERSIIELGKKSLLGKAKARPDLVKRAIEKAKKEGFRKTFQEAMGRLDMPTPLGYSSAGVVIEAGNAAHEFAPGDRVACIGQGFASHAEFVKVPMNMACKIPENVSEAEASFGMLGIIALHGIRKANLTFGSDVVVFGLGLLGLLSVQLLKAYGCRVYAIDLIAEKVELAKQLGADFSTTDYDQLKTQIEHDTAMSGVDAVVLTVATKSDQPVTQSIPLIREQGKLVVVGVADIHPERNELWHNEVEIVVSKAAGAGSLEDQYEKEGIDIPKHHARWSQKRNLAEFLRLIADGHINIKPLISHHFQIDEAEKVYSDIIKNKLPGVIGVLFDYYKAVERNEKLDIHQSLKPTEGKIVIDVIGAGVFGKALFLPTLQKSKKLSLNTLITSSGVNAHHNAKKFGFQHCGTELLEPFKDKTSDAVVGLLPHSMHAQLVKLAIEHQKPLFLEKPLCTTMDELIELEEMAKEGNAPFIMLGHNRRYSPHAKFMREKLAKSKSAKILMMRVNSGFVPADHWVHSDKEGRSRIVGEMSHFIDLMWYLLGEKPISVFAERLSENDQSIVNNDNVIVTLKFSGGSIGTLTYVAAGYKGYSRELTEIFFDGKTLWSQDFKKSSCFTEKGIDKFKTSGQEMGYKEEIDHFALVLSGKVRPEVLLADHFYLMSVIFAIEESLSLGKLVNLH